MSAEDFVRSAKIVELRREGYSYGNIGKIYGISRQRIEQILQRYGASGRFPKKAKPIKPLPKTPEEIFEIRSRAFWSHIDMTNKDGCWEWTRSRTRFGYGRYKFSMLEPNSQGYAHRVAWILTNGEIPNGMQVCHSCDNPPCCNPSHLWLGTMQENVKDRDKKRRNRQIKESLRQDILREYKNGASQAKIARTYGVCLRTVHNVIYKKGCHRDA